MFTELLDLKVYVHMMWENTKNLGTLGFFAGLSKDEVIPSVVEETIPQCQQSKQLQNEGQPRNSETGRWERNKTKMP